MNGASANTLIFKSNQDRELGSHWMNVDLFSSVSCKLVDSERR